jgi:predicted Zn-dependent protease
MAGGKIAFYSGIVSKLDLEDDEIAAVMGHEIAHALREHTREQMAQGRAARLGFQSAEMAGIAKPATLERGIWAWQNLISTGFSRLQEAEADRIGLELAARAGYDPDAARRLWEKMRAESGAPSHPLAAFLSTHPSHEARIADLTAMAEVVRPLYIVANRSEP